MSKKLKNPAKLSSPIISEINFAYQKVVSYSQFSTYQQCPHKWYLTNVEKMKGVPSIHMVFGTAIHHVLQVYISEMYATSGTQADRLDVLEIFVEKYREEYLKQYEANEKQHFSNPEEMREFYEDGVEIIKWFLSHRREYFTTRNCYLIGVEKPLQVEVKKNVIFVGYIDLILYDVDLDKIIIYDLKTSTRGWNQWQKKDDNKLSQILLYKKYFSDLYKFPIEKIDVEFLVLKRKVEPTEFQEFPKRIQSIRPAAGKTKVKQALTNFEEFIKTCFDEEGKPIRKEYPKNITKLCDYCIFNNTTNCIK